jgi:UDP-2,4-diacetamido-2,4,6-trideoxy-beta-L-altropyranose hydrolase
VRVAFRVDASMQIGTGHFMRCLALAASLKRAGARCHFVCRHALEHLRAMAVEAGHGFDTLESARFEDSGDLSHSSWLQTSQDIDASQTLHALSDRHWDWLVVDHYALDARWESVVSQAWPGVLVIDDLADRQHDCRVLLDQNLFPDMDARYVGKVRSHCQLLLGPCYALLREEFSELRASTKLRQGRAHRILVQMGGVDADNQTEKAVEAITRLRGRSFIVDVVVGRQQPARDRLEAICERHGFRLHVQTAAVAALMSRADLAIGAAGSSSWERCCLGLPTICIGQATHQVEMAKGLQMRGAIVNLGDAANVSVENLYETVASLIDQPERLASLSAAASELVDGKGAERVCQRLMDMA